MLVPLGRYLLAVAGCRHRSGPGPAMSGGM
jgi:hypothetical protein